METSSTLDWESSYSERLECSTGWVARLEVFAIEDCEVVASLEAPLPPEEICLQLYQSMAPSPSGCSIQVPVSISPNGRHFTVLRTLYSLEGQIPTLSYTSEQITVNGDDKCSGFWALPKVDHWLQEAGSLILYWLYFDNADCYLSLVVQSHPNPLSVHVFALRRGQSPLLEFSGQAVQELPRPIEGYYPGRDRREFELAFHPHLPLLAIAGLSGIFLWDFGPKHAATGFINLDGTQNQTGYGKVQLLCFSADGNACILQRRGQLPTVVDISQHLSSKYSTLPSLQLRFGEDKCSRESLDISTPSVDRSINVSTHSALTASSNTHRTLLPGSTRLNSRGQDAGEAVLANEGEAISLSKFANTSQRQSMALSRIPRLAGSRDLKPSVVLQNSSDDTVKIVLDKGPSTGNRLSANKAQPMIVERNIGAIQRTHQALNGQPLLLTGGSSTFGLLDDRPFSLEDRGDTSRVPQVMISGKLESETEYEPVRKKVRR